jgi:hypothetical protein
MVMWGDKRSNNEMRCIKRQSTQSHVVHLRANKVRSLYRRKKRLYCRGISSANNDFVSDPGGTAIVHHILVQFQAIYQQLTLTYDMKGCRVTQARG